MLLITDLNSSENFAKSGEQFFLQFVIKFRPTFGEGIKERIENWLGECVKVLFKEVIVLFFALDW